MRSRPTGGHLGGSYPLPPKGIAAEDAPNHQCQPLAKPKLLEGLDGICEHVGRKRQTFGKMGEMNPLYVLMAPTANLQVQMQMLII